MGVITNKSVSILDGDDVRIASFNADIRLIKNGDLYYLEIIHPFGKKSQLFAKKFFNLFRQKPSEPK